MNKPHEISTAEWQEIMQVPAVKKRWKLEDDDSVEFFAKITYGVSFLFLHENPDYKGPLIILQGQSLSLPPMLLIRKDGKFQEWTNN